jgi:HAE1 family hydrophobic/amphiphilic exporter-1
MQNNDENKTIDTDGFSLAKLSISRPIFITCVIIVMLILGYMSLRKLPVDLFPDVAFPVVSVTTPYPGAGPKEVEILVSKVFEEEISTISGIKRISSVNREGSSSVVVEFDLDVDIKYAEQQVRDRVSSAKTKLPTDVEESVIRRIDPADLPIVTISLNANLDQAKLYDLANLKVKTKVEQINQVGLVEILGGRKREIKVNLDLNKMNAYQLSALQVVDSLGKAGQNIPSGKIDVNKKSETVFRTLGEFQNIGEIKNTVVSFFGNEKSVILGNVAEVKEDLEDEKNLAYVNGKRSLFIFVYRQSGANTVAVAEDVVETVKKLNEELATQEGSPVLEVVRDGSIPIKDNIIDVKESIFIGIALTVLVVFFFLSSFRSTVITSLALPNSLLGAFILVAAFGFSINVMTLLALSLAVGLLIDDAIVVRENIFRHLEMGKKPIQAALEGTKEVTLAVIATALSVIAVFGPIAFLDGVVGQFFKEFGLTICFALLISLFDALTIAPMMSAYFVSSVHAHGQEKKSFYDRTVGRLLDWFNVMQSKIEDLYGHLLGFSLKRPLIVIAGGILIFVISIASLKYVPKTFLPPQDQGEFQIDLDLPPGTSLTEMNRVAQEVDSMLRSHKEIAISVLNVGTKDGEANKASFYIKLVPRKERSVNTIVFKQNVRDELKNFSYANPQVKDYDAIGGGIRPFNLDIKGNNEEELKSVALMVFEKMRVNPALKDVDISYRAGKPEFQIIPDRVKAENLGVSTTMLGTELRTLVEGQTPAVFRINGEEYDIRVRLQEDQRNLKEQFNNIYVPNINYRMIPLKNLVQGVDETGPVSITRQDRARSYRISADITPGAGMGDVINELKHMFATEVKLPQGMSYSFVGQAEDMQELVINMAIAAVLGIIFIYMVLSSLYESFITPLTIMLVLPLAACGAFFALLITQSSLDIFSMIGCIMLLGVSTKNSIILVDYANQQIQKGLSFGEAITLAGRHRLRPILMTSFALIAGMLPIAIGLNEASKQRTSMGIAVIGGLISSTILTLVVVPAAYTYIERFRVWSNGIMKRIFIGEQK